VIPARFDYEVADSVDHAIELLGRHEDAKLLAGGHSLLPMMRLRLAQPATLVDIGRIGELSHVREDGDRIAIGALTPYWQLERDALLAQHCGLVAHVAGLVGDPQVRHRGTIGGSVAHADPASDMPTVLLVLDAELVVRGPGGDRTVGAADFFRGVFETALGEQDVLTEIRVPKLGGAGWSYLKFGQRAIDWATVGVAVAGRNGTTAVALTHMGPTPVRATAVEQALAGGADAATAAEHAADGTSPPTDTYGDADYRRALAKVLTRRALERAASSA
jgi:carbon-monoxide dehydrogenase medium subunit